MKPFKLILGNSNNVTKFEDEVARAMENGYELSGEMIIKVIENQNKPLEILFFQPMTIEEHLDFDDDDFEEEDDDNEEESDI